MLKLEEYSDKSIVVRGSTELFIDELSNLSGKYNAFLKGGKGWIFSKSKQNSIEELIKKIDNKTILPKVANKNTSNTPQQVNISKTEYLGILTRLERLEQLVAHLGLDDSQNTLPKIEKLKLSKNNESDDEDEQEKSEPKKLLKKKIQKNM